MKKVLLILGILMVVGIVGIIGFCQWIGSEMKPYVDVLMVDCDAGRYQEAYDRAATVLKAKEPFETFRAYMQTRKNLLGAYKGLGRVSGFGTSRSTETGDENRISVDVLFEKGTYPGEFSFRKEDGDWKWMRLSIDIPEAELPHASPAQLESTARELIQVFAEGELVALYERFTPELKEAWPAETFQRQMVQLRQALGAFEEATHVSTSDTEEGRRVEMSAVFENATKTVRINLIDRDGTWQPLGFSMEGE